ncbi:hypothetical protein JAAARDRAFT_214404, partial [Jaapia argillacea MUCL 33604]
LKTKDIPVQIITYSPVNYCPQEIWQHIFALACLDDGTTGRSLSLVSRYIRLVSHPLRYQSIAVHGLRQLISLASILDANMTTLQPFRVRHLFVAQDGGFQIRSSAASIDRPRSIIRRVRDMISPRPAPETSFVSPRQYPNFRNTLLRVLANVTETLETLTISIPPGFEMSFPPSPLTLLRELTLYGHWYKNSLFLMVGPDYVFPSLRRLHLAGSFFFEAQVYATLQVSPLLTHLRLSGLEYSASVANIVASILRLPLEDHQVLPAPPVSLHKILVQRRDPPSRGAMALSHDLAIETLLSICSKHPEPDNGLVVLKYREWNPVQVQVAEAKDFWLSRVEGGLGCWDESERWRAMEVGTGLFSIGDT